MKYTKEQIDIIESDGNIQVNAVAGSGKTSTIIGYAEARPDAKILYVAFNKTVKEEAIKRFEEKDITNVKVETAHSLAYKAIVVPNRKYKITNGYKMGEIVDMLTIKGDADKHSKYILAAHIKKFISYFCNSSVEKIQDLNYLDIVESAKAKDFVGRAYAFIEEQTRILLGKMDKAEIAIVHDFYLKKYQLSNPVLDYDFILFDEGQDASPAMLDIFFKQKATKVIVGDTHQQIYSWRFAVNSMDKSQYKTFNLSTSFRFNQGIANLAMSVLDLKDDIENAAVIYDQVNIKGIGTSTSNTSKCIISRTNLGLLLKAIKYIEYYDKIYFEGNIYSYTYADEGTSLYDVLNLFLEKKSYIKDKVIAGMANMEELDEYIDKTEDVQLRSMVEIVKKYKGRVAYLIKEIKDKHVDKKEDADMIFSTVHRCKGMEYDHVELSDDFITEKKLTDQNKKIKEGRRDLPAKINEELNLLYVAITRTKNILEIPQEMIPKRAGQVTKNIKLLYH